MPLRLPTCARTLALLLAISSLWIFPTCASAQQSIATSPITRSAPAHPRAGAVPDEDAKFLVSVPALVSRAHRVVANGAVMLADVRIQHLGEDGTSTLHVQQVTYIGSDDAARDQNHASIQFSPDSQVLEILHVRTFKADGTVVEGECAGETPVADVAASMYYDLRSRNVRFRDVEKGDVLELEYRVIPRLSGNAVRMPFTDPVAFRSSLPERLKRYLLIAPAGKELAIHEQRMPPASISVARGQRTWRWELHDVAALPTEPHRVPLTEVAPYVHVSAFRSWDEAGQWYAQLIRPQFELDETLRGVLSNLIAGTETHEQKISAIYEFVVRNTRYVAWEFGEYGFKPYSAAQTYARRFGDCKDKATLLIALLRAAGIDAQIALVRTRRMGALHSEPASISSFNHAVAYIPKYDLWLDGTSESASLHELPLDDQDATALTVSLDGRAQLRHIPMNSPHTITAEVRTAGADWSAIRASGPSHANDVPAERNSHDAPSVASNSPTTDRAPGTSFYAASRRDGMEFVRKSAARRFSGGPAVFLLNDQILRVRPDGSTDVYVHQITRVLNRNGIDRYGEVAIPSGAELLQLRTIKPDGTTAEPELSTYKSTVSMTALAAGDAIEQEYVLHGVTDSKFLRFDFGSFLAPVLHSRFVVISPADAPAKTQPVSNSPRSRVLATVPERIEQWERDDIPQFVSEAAMPKTGLLPYVEVQSSAVHDWKNVREYYRNAIIKAARSSVRIEHRARTFTSSDQRERGREIYRFVTSRMRGTYPAITQNLPSADETLAFGEGSKTIALLALYRAAGVQADLLLARDLAGLPAQQPALDIYSRPLLRLTLRDPAGETSETIVDAETDRIAFGILPPTVDRARALVVSLDRPQPPPAFVSLPPDVSSEQSIAEGDVYVDAAGNVSATLRIALGATRAAQLRTSLHGLTGSQRQQFFEQMTDRIFPGAIDVLGQTRNEADPDLPLELTVRCRSNNVVVFHGSRAEVDQLVPSLGLRKMYASGSVRRFPLYIDTAFVESARFRIHLPAGTHAGRLVPDFDAKNDFGAYLLQMHELSPDLLEIERSFKIPAQVVAPERYPEFARFALQVDDAERERIAIERNPTQ